VPIVRRSIAESFGVVANVTVTPERRGSRVCS
jgi:hypothetical protein